MRTSVAALALVRRPTASGGVEYLARWDERRDAFHFVGGHKGADESFRACCVREAEKGLGLTDGQHFRVAAGPLAHLEYVAFSRGSAAETAYTVELFEVDLLGDAARTVAADPANRWLSEADVRACRCRDGQAVSDRMLRLLALAGLTPGEFDLFVSYARQDDHDGWVAAFVDAIRAEHARFTNVPLRIFFDREAIRTMDDWEHRILTGLRSAKVMLAVLSPSYAASDFCRREWETYLEHELALALPGDGIAPIYTVTVPGFADGTATADRLLADLFRRQYVDARPWRTEGAAALRRKEVRRRLQVLEQEIDDQLRRAARAASSLTHALPGHNPNFVGRHDELRRLREILAFNQAGAIAAVQGIGGIGKAALAFEYAHGFAEHYPGGRFVLRAEGAEDFRAAVVDQLRAVLGVELSDDEKKCYDLSFPRVWAALRGRGRSLLVLDNLDRPELLTGAKRSGVLPAGDAVHVVATTRLEPGRLEDRENVRCLLVDALPPEDGLRLLRRYRATAGDDEWKAALALVHRLGGHALALEVVGVFLWKNPEVSYRDYLTRLEAEGAGAVEGAAHDERVELSRHPEKFIGRLLEPTLATLSPAELRALGYAARLPADVVPLPWLWSLLESDVSEVRTPRPGYADSWKQIERRLDGLRLVVRDPKEPRLGRIHRVVRDEVVARMRAEVAAERRKATIAASEGTPRFSPVWDLPGPTIEVKQPELSEVQFTVYRPRSVRPGVWYPLLAFTHLAERRPDAPAEEPDPIKQVQEQARQVLGARVKDFRETSTDARRAIPREGELTLLPDVPGLEFNPPRRIFRWIEDVHREEFRLRAAAERDGTTARGRLSVYLGAILLAEVDLAIRVDSGSPTDEKTAPLEADSSRPYRKIFASYSHRDAEIVRQYERFVASTGDRYLRDVRDLRAGEEWDAALLQLIDQADVFQLFWSRNAMDSPFVQREWEYALSLGRPAFIRPTYWEEPLPESPERGLPPSALRKLHFHRLGFGVALSHSDLGDEPVVRKRPSEPASMKELGLPMRRHKRASGCFLLILMSVVLGGALGGVILYFLLRA
jgi:hypothetical protein